MLEVDPVPVTRLREVASGFTRFPWWCINVAWGEPGTLVVLLPGDILTDIDNPNAVYGPMSCGFCDRRSSYPLRNRREEMPLCILCDECSDRDDEWAPRSDSVEHTRYHNYVAAWHELATIAGHLRPHNASMRYNWLDAEAEYEEIRRDILRSDPDAALQTLEQLFGEDWRQRATIIPGLQFRHVRHEFGIGV